MPNGARRMAKKSSVTAATRIRQSRQVEADEGRRSDESPQPDPRCLGQVPHRSVESHPRGDLDAARGSGSVEQVLVAGETRQPDQGGRQHSCVADLPGVEPHGIREGARKLEHPLGIRRELSVGQRPRPEPVIAFVRDLERRDDEHLQQAPGKRDDQEYALGARPGGLFLQAVPEPPERLADPPGSHRWPRQLSKARVIELHAGSLQCHASRPTRKPSTVGRTRQRQRWIQRLLLPPSPRRAWPHDAGSPAIRER